MKAILILFLSALLVACSNRLQDTNDSMPMLAKAVQDYYSEDGVPPPGDTVAIMRALKGENPRHCVYIEFSAANTAADGTLQDGWGTPYRVDFSDAHSLRILSAGPDRQFGTTDDLSLIKPL